MENNNQNNNQKQVITTKKAPSPVGPYSQAMRFGELLFCSGQVPIDPQSGEVLRGDVVSQTQKVMDNISAVLEAASLNFNHVVKTTIFLTDMNDFAKVNEVYEKSFLELPPARSCVAVSALPKGVNVEIEVIAHFPQ